MAEIVIVGAGLAGLSCGLLLAKQGVQVTIIEKHTFPAHKVCGEYISNEVLPFLGALEIDVFRLNPSRITELELTSEDGKCFSTRLPLGGFGLSRYELDHLLYRKAIENGITVLTGTKVNDIHFGGTQFQVILSDSESLSADVVIGAYGKRSNLDQKLRRWAFYDRSPYIGVKYHIKTDLAPHVIQLHSFNTGYCGICKIENDKYNLCYLVKNHHLKKAGSITELEEQVLFRNPQLKRHFRNAEFVYKKPLVINEISFSRKTLVEDHLLFCGDAAGMISPLCGNGMAMAIHSGKLLGEAINVHLQKDPRLERRDVLENLYQRHWQQQFGLRLRTGKAVQALFLKPVMSRWAVSAFNLMPSMAKMLVKKTHGQPF